MASGIGRFGKRASRLIDFGLWAAAALLLLTAGVGALGTARLSDNEADIHRASEVISGLERLLALARDMETSQRGYILTGKPDYLQPYKAALPEIRKQFDALTTLVQDDAVQQQRLATLRMLLEKKQHELAATIELRKTEGFDAAQAIVSSDAGKIFMDRARVMVNEMEATVQQQLRTLRDRARATRDIAIGVGLASGLLTLAVCVSFGYVMRRLLLVEAAAAHDLFEQRELLHVTLASIGDGVIATDVGGRITFFNRVAEEMTALCADAVVGQPIEQVLTFRHAATQRVIDNPARVAVERRRTASLPPHTRFVGRSGGELPVDGNAAPTFDANGKLVGAVLVVRDVSERERAEERFRLAVEAAPTAMIMVGRDGRIVLVNSQAEKLFGYARGDMIGHGIDMLVPERFRAGHWAHRDAFFGNPDARPMGEGRDLFGLRRDGSEFPVEIGLNPITTSEGAFVLCSIADITARKRAELELRRRSEELARSNQDLEQFAYVASHDLQEPLRAVAGPLQLLQRRYQGQLDARADEFIGHAVDGATRMQSLIDDLLSYSRVGRLEDARRPVDCEHVLDEALRNLSAAIRESGAQVTHDPLPTVHGIEAQLVLLFQNLIGNAIKFRSKDRVARIHLEAHTRDDAWLLRVRDNGIGIDPQYFERIFLIFQRLHTRREYPGTGLGLALCKRIVEHHGGRIFVESEPGQGTTFSFTLSRPGADETRWPRDPRE
ncbi:sensor histidine kinase [Burkholderia pseudomallei]|uniref:sensor histidine kinase n=1 Tax=Burkholderia pseudomallei TaxID=28450 RepID=UPI00052A3BB8|nr:CHASE3 domain-containing protein [Burkholderia pseudomallei]AIV86807.1 sensory box protein [Burkholderia pseudomallei B03]AIV92117.1 sensory box protein [Burkholderia pseudomallei A79A]KGV77102.1 sensory box protein [Burkholderia pseudomallei MSHR4375]